MLLKEYLKENNLTHNDFIEKCADECGVLVSQGAVAKWCSGARVPRRTEAHIIYKVTNGKVMPNDFYNLDIIE